MFEQVTRRDKVIGLRLVPAKVGGARLEELAGPAWRHQAPESLRAD